MSIENMEKILCLNADALSKGGEDNKEHVLFMMHSLLQQIVAHLKGENLDCVADPDVVITFEEDCGNEADNSN
jgi:hypothetical protein